MRKRIAPWLAFCAALLGACLAPPAAGAATFDEFGIESVSAEQSTAVAGMHPDLSTGFVLKSEELEALPGTSVSVGRLEDASVDLPPGLIGDPTNFPTCSIGQFVSVFANCPIDSQVGTMELRLSDTEAGAIRVTPLYNLEVPDDDAVARLGFWALTFPTFIDVRVRTASDYGLTASVQNSAGLAAVISAKANLWGNPADPVHNPQRLTTFESNFCKVACMAPGEERPSGLTPIPFLSNPTACGPQKEVNFTVSSYELPGQTFSAQAPLPPITGCDALSFQPSMQVTPTSRRAGAPTGLSAILRIPQTNAVNVPATAAMRRASVVLPEGMTISPNGADGLAACSESQVGLGTEAASACPPAAKLGTATFVSPTLPEPLRGSIYQRTPAPGHLFRLWLVSDDFGLHLKIPGEVKPDPASGRLTAVFEETPQLPVEEIDLEFKSGDHAPLKNPDSCGSFAAEYELTPWSGAAPVVGQSQMTIDEGCAPQGFRPTLSAGVTSPVAGRYSPLLVELDRRDGEENISGLNVTLPEGELAKLRGVPECPDAGAATGACPAASRIGSVAVAAGVGSQPLWVPQPGKEGTAVFLAGPYRGAPLSIVTRVPAQAGPFDLGTVVVRAAVHVDPETARVRVDSDPLPQVLEGVPVRYRTIHIALDRPDFSLNPTSCERMRVSAVVTSARGSVADPSDRFQVGECASLPFRPRLELRLKGGRSRGDYPALTARLRTKPGEANIGKVSVALPHSEFLAQEHIVTVCTRVQFAADRCPPGSIYGRARAVTPLLAKPLSGPVYLRSSNHGIPDLVAALHGQIDIDLVGRIDSVDQGIRTTFRTVPDAPVTRFVLKMRGGKKSLLVNSADICEQRNRATVKMDGQNGKVFDTRVPLRAGCGKRARG